MIYIIGHWYFIYSNTQCQESKLRELSVSAATEVSNFIPTLLKITLLTKLINHKILLEVKLKKCQHIMPNFVTRHNKNLIKVFINEKSAQSCLKTGHVG